jgi:outer membrane biosynthesis protein TonB
MKDDVLQSEERNRKTGFIISFTIHIIALLLCLIPFVTMIKFPPEESGIMVMFGETDSGISDNAEKPVQEEQSKPVVNQASKQPEVVKSKTRDEIADVIATDSKKTNSNAKSSADERAKKEKERLETERIEKEAREKEAAEKKKKISDLFGKGKGDGGKPGDQGVPTGVPDGKILDGITKGSGRVGGGLSSRGLIFEPVFQDNSQRSGRVVLTICVDSNGKVISSKFTQKGSTTSDPYLIQITEKTASKYKFSPSDVDSQCGTITVDYKVQ